MTCNDVRRMPAGIKRILTNPEVLAVHKDPLARMAVRLDVGGGAEENHAGAACSAAYSVYGRVLRDGSSAVMLLNRGNDSVSAALPLEVLSPRTPSLFILKTLVFIENVCRRMALLLRRRLKGGLVF